MFFPSQYPVTKDNMNYAVVIIGGILILAAIYWIFSARHWFVGPKRTTTHAQELSLNQPNSGDINDKERSPSIIHIQL